MKLLVDKMPSYPEDCPFSMYDRDEDRHTCTLNDYFYCEGINNGECMMCITYDKFMFEKIEKCKNATCINICSVD